MQLTLGVMESPCHLSLQSRIKHVLMKRCIPTQSTDDETRNCGAIVEHIYIALAVRENLLFAAQEVMENGGGEHARSFQPNHSFEFRV